MRAPGRTRLPAEGRLPAVAGALILVAALAWLPRVGWAQPPPPGAAASPRAPLLCTHPRARDFDFWLGEWDVVNRNRPPEGVGFYETGRATDRVYAVVGGCGIVEHWRGDAISSFIVGFSLRAYDPADDEWTLVLLWPTNGRPPFGELRGGFRHGRGEFSFRRVLPQGDTAVNRFTFSDITPTSLRWENATSRDGGLSWTGNWIMEFTRRDPVADVGLWNGPAMTTRRCPGEEHRRFDAHLGAWSGVRVDAGGDSLPVRAEVVRILEGCAVMERVWSEGEGSTGDEGGEGRGRAGRWEAFRVRAYEPDADRWVEYALESERRALVRLEAPTGGELVFREVSAPDGTLTRRRWDPGEGGEPGWVVEESEGPDGPWRLRARLRLRQPLGGVRPP